MDTDRLSLLYCPKPAVVVLRVSLPARLCSAVRARSPLSPDLAGSLAASCCCLGAFEQLTSSPAACATCQSPRGIYVSPATWQGSSGCLPPPAQAQQPTTHHRGAIRSGLPELPLPKLVQALPSLQPVPEALDHPVPAATAALAPANVGGCQALWSGRPGLFQAALPPALLLQQSYFCSPLHPLGSDPACWVRVSDPQVLHTSLCTPCPRLLSQG